MTTFNYNDSNVDGFEDAVKKLAEKKFSSYVGKHGRMEGHLFYRDGKAPVVLLDQETIKIINEQGMVGLDEDIETVKKILGLI